LIGAEGAHSLVREYLVGPEKAVPQTSPLVASATMAKLPAEAALKFKEFASRLMVIFHPSGYFTWFGSTLSTTLDTGIDADVRIVHDAYGDSKPGDWT